MALYTLQSSHPAIRHTASCSQLNRLIKNLPPASHIRTTICLQSPATAFDRSHSSMQSSVMCARSSTHSVNPYCRGIHTTIFRQSLSYSNVFQKAAVVFKPVYTSHVARIHISLKPYTLIQRRTAVVASCYQTHRQLQSAQSPYKKHGCYTPR